MKKLFSWIGRKLRIIVVVPETAPGTCVCCGRRIAIPLTRNSDVVKCDLCGAIMYSMAIGVVSNKKSRLKYVIQEVDQWVMMADGEYTEAMLEKE